MSKHGGRRKGAGRKKGIGLSFEIQAHCERFIKELLSEEAIKRKAIKQLELCLESEEPSVGYCYVIQSNPKGGAIKIGYTSNWNNRKKQYDTHLPYYRLLHLYEGVDAFDVEGDLHAMFSDYFQKGEWFDLPLERVLDLCVELTSRKHGRTQEQ